MAHRDHPGPTGRRPGGLPSSGGAQNFLILSRRLVGTDTSRGTVGVRSRFGAAVLGSRTIRVGAFPISVDSGALDHAARDRNIRRRAREIRTELGNPRKILLGVDRLDYTKGIDVRLKAFPSCWPRAASNATTPSWSSWLPEPRAGGELPDAAQRHRTPGRPH